MRILYDHQVFSLQDAGGASRYHFELVRNLQGLDEVAIELLVGLNGSVMPFATLQQARTRSIRLRHRDQARLGPLRDQRIFLGALAPAQGEWISTIRHSIEPFPGCAGGVLWSPTTTASMSGFPIYSRMPPPS